MKAILTVVGQDKVGIVAAVSNKLAALSVNILDISQTIMEKNFTMMMMLDLESTTDDFITIKNQMTELGNQLGLTIHIQREDIFNTMHKL
ncbi:ACT domain-containing protein [Vagococcus elongatus]|uniref:UPF0237 protein CBF29_12965 n=1 Tax=Vagococcus elongatus TaxID=180344 RepID=A0A430ALD6_9ENTE|nr:ACT domain-containing protein [Vagococcus elongatus]RSU08896.1 hypothetical protein CBF29_12965 [Vagococcus elongatus]